LHEIYGVYALVGRNCQKNRGFSRRIKSLLELVSEIWVQPAKRIQKYTS
jgi:hypothetical protein